MSDLISRADAIDAVAKLCVDGYKAKVDGYFIPLTDALINTLSSLSSAEAEWIPCSERLPGDSGEYLVTIPLDEDETYVNVFMFHKGKFYEDDAEWGATYYDDVLAWQPLPKPYEGGDSE